MVSDLHYFDLISDFGRKKRRDAVSWKTGLRLVFYLLIK